jgi:hypothetical protein
MNDQNKSRCGLSRRIFLRTSGALLAANYLRQPAVAQIPAVVAADGASPVVSVRTLGDQFLTNPLNVTGLDGATSTKLPSGDALWLFGDTVEGPFDSIRKLELTRLRSNTGAIVPPQDASDGIKKFKFLSEDEKRPRQLIPFASDEDPARNRIWAIHGVCVGENIYLFYHRISLLKGVDVFENFQLDGMGIARAKASDLDFTRLKAPDGTREFWKGSEPTFGVFAERTAEYIYLWGSLATAMYLARVKPDALEDLASYEYLVQAPTRNSLTNEVRWSKKFEATAPLFDSVPNEMSAAYNPHLEQYVAFHSHHRDNKIVMRTASRITGPWSSPHLLFQPPKKSEADLIYAAKEHPELARLGGQVLYVTYVNSATYVPQMIEVTMK